MKKTFLFLLPLLAFSLSSCSLKEKYAKNSSAAEAWLNSAATQPARSNFEGIYYSPDWGTLVLNQDQDKLSGQLSYFQVKGVVSGRTASLILVDDSWVEHSVVLRKKNSEVLEGAYSDGVPFSSKSSKPITLFRIVN